MDIYDGIITKPDIEEVFIKHYNHNHSPKDGKFVSGSGGGGVVKSSKRIDRKWNKAYKKHSALKEKAEDELAKDIVKSRKKNLGKIKVSRRTNRAVERQMKYDDKVRKKFKGTNYEQYRNIEDAYVKINPSHFNITKKKEKKK